jgi:microcystin-dependent protein
MAQPYVGEIRLFAGNFAPAGWLNCNGALLPISEFETLFQLIGTTYGGDGQETFALPDLRGRVPIHQGTGAGITYMIGQTGGVETVTLTAQQYPAHSHGLRASNAVASGAAGPTGVLAASTATMYGTTVAPSVAMAANAISGTAGAGSGFQAHENMAPFLTLTYIISLFGIYPSPT